MSLQHSSDRVQVSTQSNQTGFPDERKKIRIVSTGPIVSAALVHYLGQRRIPAGLAQVYCREIRYELYGKQYYAIGFPNDAGGYELRNPYFKGSCSPKDISFMDNGAKQVAVFEGFFNFLSFLALHGDRNLLPTNFLVLNSLSFFERNQPLMEKHEAINLYLDRDAAGKKYTALVVKENSPYKDCSMLYQNCKDLNQQLIQNFLQIQQEGQALKRAKGIADDQINKQVTRNGKKGRQF